MAEAKKSTKLSKTKTVTNPTTKPAEESKKVTTEVATETTETITPSVETAKAGKRSAKAQKEVAEKTAKEQRKAQSSSITSDEKPKPVIKPTRSRLERRGKKFRQAAQQIEKGKQYMPGQAIDLAIQTSPTKFDATVELHINLLVDPRQADQNVRDNLLLPAGTGKLVRVALFADEKVEGADVVGVDTLSGALEKGAIDFDVLIATPTTMPKLGKFARLLGPRGLMPNPKSGTVTNDVAKAVAEAKAGRVEYRVDSTGIVHLGIGKVSFGKEKLHQNFDAVISSIKVNKPASIKGGYIKSVHLATTMGPSISVSTADL